MKVVLVGMLPKNLKGALNSSQKVLIDIYNEFLSIDKDVVFLNLDGRNRTGYEDYENIKDVSLKELVVYLAKEKPDVVHVLHFTGKSLLLISELKKLIGYKLFYTCNGCVYKEKINNEFLGWKDEFIEKRALRCSNKVFPISHRLRDIVLHRHKEDQNKFVVIYNGVSKKKIIEKDIDIRRKYGIKEESIVIFSSGTSKSKNIESIIKNIEMIEDRNIVLVIAGKSDTKYAKKLQKEHMRKINSGELIFTGYISENEMLNWYKTANVYMQLSSYETFGVAVAEAIVQGTPVIVSDEVGILGIVNINDSYVQMVWGESFDLSSLLDRVSKKKIIQLDMPWKKTVEKYYENYIDRRH